MNNNWLAKIAADYIAVYRPGAAAEVAHYRDLPTVEDAISQAALAKDSAGNKHSHQRHVLPESLKESERRLMQSAEALKTAASFHELIELVHDIIASIYFIGELTVYDTALRIGAHRGLEPERVYLHRGTRKGAAALGLGAKREWLDMSELPAQLRVLSPREAEDALCIYKSVLQKLADGEAIDLAAIRACGTRYRGQGGCAR